MIEQYGENNGSGVFAGYINTKPDPIDDRYSISDKVYVEIDKSLKPDSIIDELSKKYPDFSPNKKFGYEWLMAATREEREAKAEIDAAHHQEMLNKYPQYFINGHIYFSGKKMKDSYELESALRIEQTDRQNEWNRND